MYTWCHVGQVLVAPQLAGQACFSPHILPGAGFCSLRPPTQLMTRPRPVQVESYEITQSSAMLSSPCLSWVQSSFLKVTLQTENNQQCLRKNMRIIRIQLLVSHNSHADHFMEGRWGEGDNKNATEHTPW